jgi:lysophospholipase L1-like esterase
MQRFWNVRSASKALAVFGATMIAALVCAGLVELWVRARWDERRGTPGFYVSDAALGQRLRAGYSGWFAGVPVHINSLGFRDTRDYDLKKTAGTFRILVFGDSVTFGHGAVYETTYPYLLEGKLKAWRPDVKWEVWNLGVPGYNTGQELAYLREVGARYNPDLVIIGFYENDLIDNVVPDPTSLDRAKSAVQGTMQRYLYSYELYRRVALTLRYRLMTSAADRQRLEQIDGEGALLERLDKVADAAEQRLTEVDYFDGPELHDFLCEKRPRRETPGNDSLIQRLRTSSEEIALWRRAVEELQRMNRAGPHRIMFFINMAPRICPDSDRYQDGGSLSDDEALTHILGAGTPVASSTRAFLHYRPSQMPAASGHSLGNANRVKADALFDVLRAQVLPQLLTPAAF